MSHRTERRGESGETLLETIVTVALLGTVVLGIVGALTTSIVVADRGRRSSRAFVEATTRAEAYLDPSVTYVPCTPAANPDAAHPVTYSPTLPALPTGYTSTYKVDYLKVLPAASTTPQTADFQAGCPATDQGIQRITITVTAGSTNASRTVVVLKRDVRCSAAAAAQLASQGAGSQAC